MRNTRAFSISEIAAWALPTGQDQTQPGLNVELPALQRGSVWPAHQVERLWDSLVRGFPIGCFILSQPQPHLGVKPFAPLRGAPGLENVTGTGHLLLDGQQRATAIATAFLDPWRNPEQVDAEFAFWIDLEPLQKSAQSDHAFRLLTRSHPWGYQRQDPAERLSTSARRQAMQEYEASARCSGHEALVFRPGHLPLAHAWPYDAKAPVPVLLILDAIRRLPSNCDDTTIWATVHRDVIDALGMRMDWIRSDSQGIGMRFDTGVLLRKLLSAPTDYMALLLSGLRRLLDNSDDGLRIPAQWLPREHIGGIPPDDQVSDREDPVLTLFVRINTAGVQPNGEELTYSILKSVMPECRGGIEALSRHFMPPPRMVLLLSTLVLAKLSSRRDAHTPPAFPDVSRFRRLVQGVDPGVPDFRDALRAMLQNGEAESVVKAAHRLLVVDPNHPDERTFRLLPLQAARIAQNNEHAFLLLFTWINSRKDRKGDWLGLEEDEHRRLVGLMCALSWFYASDTNTATNRRRYLARLWKSRKELHQRGILAGLTEPDGKDVGPILPLPPPKILSRAIERCVTGWGFGTYDSNLWKEWDLWNGLQTRLDDIDDVKKWYTKNVRSQVIGDVSETEARLTERREAAWSGLVSRTISNTELVLYAQRTWLSKWYQEFDPTSPLQLQETEQPWDIDHIHPRNYVEGRHNIPGLITKWHATIGNLRAWPSEINRSQHDLDPGAKLSEPNDQEKTNYGLNTAADLQSASAIWDHSNWQQSHPGPESGAPGHYLRSYAPNTHGQWHPNRQALVRAISGRYVALYAGWYEELRVKDLF